MNVNRRNLKPSNIQNFPLEELQRFLQHDRNASKQNTAKKVFPPKTVLKNHSKSLYYYNSLHTNNKNNRFSVVNKTGLDPIEINANHQTLNE